MFENSNDKRIRPRSLQFAVLALVLVLAVGAFFSFTLHKERGTARTGSQAVPVALPAATIDATTLRANIIAWLAQYDTSNNLQYGSNKLELISAIKFEVSQDDLFDRQPGDTKAVLNGQNSLLHNNALGNPLLVTFPGTSGATEDVQLLYDSANRVLTFSTLGTHYKLTGSAKGLFADMPNLSIIDFTYVDTSEITSMESMFENDGSLASIRGVGYRTPSSAITPASPDSPASPASPASPTTPSGSSGPGYTILFSTQNVESMRNMFSGCVALRSGDGRNEWSGVPAEYENHALHFTDLCTWDLRDWNVEKVKDFSGMFQHCRSMDVLDLSSWRNAEVTSIHHMFAGLENVDTLDLSGIDIAKLDEDGSPTTQDGNLSYLFWECKALENLTQPLWSGAPNKMVNAGISTLEGTFEECVKLALLDTSAWDTSTLTTLKSAFQGCESLLSKGAILGGGDTPNPPRAGITGTFDLSHWDISNVTDLSGMLSRCRSLTTLDFLKTHTVDGSAKPYWDTSKVAAMDHLFEYCENIEQLDISTFDTSSKISPQREYSYTAQDETITTSGTTTTVYSYNSTNDRWDATTTPPGTTTTVHDPGIDDKNDTTANAEVTETLTATVPTGVPASPLTPLSPRQPGSRTVTAKVNIPEMSYMFRGCTRLTRLKVGPNCENMVDWRGSASGRITSIDLPELCTITKDS